MKLKQEFKYFYLLCLLVSFSPVFAQKLADFKIPQSDKLNETGIETRFQFNGYTNHWQNSYTQIYRNGNLFKMAIPEIQSTFLQSKINIADDLGIPGLLVQEGFVSKLSNKKYMQLQNPAINKIQDIIKAENVLVITNPDSEARKKLEEIPTPVF